MHEFVTISANTRVVNCSVQILGDEKLATGKCNGNFFDFKKIGCVSTDQKLIGVERHYRSQGIEVFSIINTEKPGEEQLLNLDIFWRDVRLIGFLENGNLICRADLNNIDSFGSRRPFEILADLSNLNILPPPYDDKKVLSNLNRESTGYTPVCVTPNKIFGWRHNHKNEVSRSDSKIHVWWSKDEDKWEVADEASGYVIDAMPSPDGKKLYLLSQNSDKKIVLSFINLSVATHEKTEIAVFDKLVRFWGIGNEGDVFLMEHFVGSKFFYIYSPKFNGKIGLISFKEMYFSHNSHSENGVYYVGGNSLLKKTNTWYESLRYEAEGWTIKEYFKANDLGQVYASGVKNVGEGAGILFPVLLTPAV